MKTYKIFYGGEWKEGANIKEISSPYDGKAVAGMHFADREQVTEAVKSAHDAFEETKRLSSFKRAEILEKISLKIEERQEELAVSIAASAGKAIKSSRAEVSRAVSTFRIAAEEAKRINGEIIPLDWSPQTEERWGIIRRFPVGLVAGITPFNFPLNLVAHKVAPAIATGNPILLRPASQVSVTSAILSEIISETDYPTGGYGYIPCDYKAADVLVEDERVKKITFTGSPEIGWEIKKRANKKRVTLELGGNAAVVIEPDSDLEFAVKRTVLGSFSYSGQICISIQRIMLHEDIYGQFMTAFEEQVRALKQGDPMEEETDIGPMINLEAAIQTEQWVKEAQENGAKLVCGGMRNGSMFAPTILEDVRPDLRISCQEAFAPVVVVTPYRDYNTALDSVNDSIYGLQAGVFTQNLKKAFHAFETLDVGGVIINDIPTFRIDHMPYGGVKESGFGREGLKYAMDEMTEMKLLAVNLKG
ncbi:aldehyde dehydrogenase family protein [Acidobacteriota bacterium]